MRFFFFFVRHSLFTYYSGLKGPELHLVRFTVAARKRAESREKFPVSNGWLYVPAFCCTFFPRSNVGRWMSSVSVRFCFTSAIAPFYLVVLIFFGFFCTWCLLVICHFHCNATLRVPLYLQLLEPMCCCTTCCVFIKNLPLLLWWALLFCWFQPKVQLAENTKNYNVDKYKMREQMLGRSVEGK